MTASSPVCVACHSQSKLAWFVKGRSFPPELSLSSALHYETDAFDLVFNGTGGRSPVREEPANRWVTGRGAYRMCVRSQSIKLPDGTVLTIVSL